METKKLIVITGASSGFGLELAKTFSKDGYPLLLLARRIEKMEALNLPNALCRKLDVTNKADFEKVIAEAEAVYGETDLLVNNAGVMLLGDISTQNPREWKKMLDVNIIGVMNGMAAVMQKMKDPKSGTIINLSSIAGLQPFGNHAAYAASKYGVRGLTPDFPGRIFTLRCKSYCKKAGGLLKQNFLAAPTDKSPYGWLQ